MVGKKSIKELSMNDLGSQLFLEAKVKEVRQTAGPTIFFLEDATGVLPAKSFDGAGKRALPNITEGIFVRALLKITEHKGHLESEILEVTPLNSHVKNSVDDKQDQSSLDELESHEPVFLSESDTLEKMRDRFNSAAAIIKNAINSSQPILLRHHADADGFGAAVALERAILPLISKRHPSDRSLYKYYKRAPSKTPYYHYDDATKDVIYFIEDQERFGTKKPLILVADNGSTEEDLLALEKLKAFACTIVVVDHHHPGEVVDGTCEVDKYIDCHINPHLVGGDSSISAGMLCAELSRFILSSASGLAEIGAIAAVADHCQGKEAETFIALSGIDRELLMKIADVIDFECHSIRYQEARSYMDMLFTPEDERSQQIISRIGDRLTHHRKNLGVTIEKYSKKTDKGDWILLELPVFEMVNRGDYPSPSKILSMARDSLQQESGKFVAAVGTGSDMISFRFSEELPFDVNTIIADLSKKLPYAGIEGGGHKRAGSMRFYPVAQVEVKEMVMGYFR